MYKFVDVNECTYGVSGCEQICVNTDGSVNCECFFGFLLNDDRKNLARTVGRGRKNGRKHAEVWRSSLYFTSGLIVVGGEIRNLSKTMRFIENVLSMDKHVEL